MKIVSVVLGIVVCMIIACSVVNAETKHPHVSPLKFERILVVILENQEFWISNLNAELSSLTKKGTLLTNHKATTHPSQPNYISIVAGDTMGVKSNSNYDVEGRNLVDLLEEKGISWKTYQEDYPGNCFDGGKSDRYRRKHNPFISFNNVRNNKERCAKIVNSDELWKDLEGNNLPQFSFYTPDMDNSGHDTGIIHAGKWTHKFVHKLLKYNQIINGTLVVLTFDEGLLIGPNKIYTLLIGPSVPEDVMDDTSYTHYSLLKTVEGNFGLGSLGRHDEKAIPFLFKNNPPRFMVTIPILVVICVAIAVFLAGVGTLSFFLIRKRLRSRRMMKDIEKKPDFDKLDEEMEHA
jgi:hypothetical protein